jgi:AraC-like DNA-binding protein
MNEVSFFNASKYLRSYVSGYLHVRQEFIDNTRPLFSPKGASSLVIPLEVSTNTYLAYPNPSDKYLFKKYVPLIFGQMSKVGYVHNLAQFQGFIIVFTPTGLFHFVQGFASDLTDHILYLEQLGLEELQSKLQAVFVSGRHPSEWIQTLDEVLLDYFDSLPQKKVRVDVSSVADEILFNKGHLVLDKLVGRVGLNMRTFQIHFKQQVGLTPKLFCRIARFNSLLNAIHTMLEFDMLTFAVDCGYTDKSHLYKDFKDFMGMTPRQYLKLYFRVNAEIEQTLLENHAKYSKKGQ